MDTTATEREQQYYTDIISAQSERTNQRMFIIILFLIVYCAVMTFLYVREKISYETIELTQEVETNSGSAYVSGIGDVNYGESKTNNKN